MSLPPLPEYGIGICGQNTRHMYSRTMIKPRGRLLRVTPPVKSGCVSRIRKYYARYDQRRTTGSAETEQRGQRDSRGPALDGGMDSTN